MTGATKLNEASSRSHAVFIIIIEQSNAARVPDEALRPGMAAAGPEAMGESPTSAEASKGLNVRVGKLNLVDLAGSERVSITGATGMPPI